MKRLRLAQMLVGPDVGLLGVDDEHFVETVIGVAMGAQPDPLTLVLFGAFLEEVYFLPSDSDRRLKAV